MTSELSSEAWAQIRHDYERTERLVADICAEHGISAGTLRDRMRRWGWTRRRSPVAFEGPPPSPQPGVGTLSAAYQAPPPDADAPPAATGGDAAAAPDERPIAQRLQSTIAHVLPAIEGTLVTLASGPAHPRELERAARALAALTRTLRELNGLLAQHPAQPVCDCGYPQSPEEMDELREELARMINPLVDRHTGLTTDGRPVPRTDP